MLAMRPSSAPSRLLLFPEVAPAEHSARPAEESASPRIRRYRLSRLSAPAVPHPGCRSDFEHLRRSYD